ncbi:MAG: D-alanyl-D-alanine carboxypeptidase [Thermoleophilia bacterium]|nr:D-alanyl-D-alanine carboxypeptidase [Thermoleophilia bacterium]
MIVGHPMKPSAPAAVVREATKIVDRWRAENAVPGITVSIRQAGNAVLDVASGVANLRSGRAIASDDRMWAASVTKTGTAALTLRLIERGDLKLSSKLSEWFPDIPAADHITVRALLKHRSGVPSFDRAPGTPWLADLACGPGHPWTSKRLMQFLKEQPASFAPGAKFEYSNGNYQLLERIIERQTGKPFDQVFKDEVLAPAGATNSKLDMGVGGDPTTVSEYVDHQLGKGPQNYDSIYGAGGQSRSVMGGAGGLVTTAPDLAKYGESILWKGGSVLTSKSRNAMFTSADKAASMYGLGVSRFGRDSDWGSTKDPHSYGHGGDLIGATADLMHIPRTQQTIAGLANTSVSHESIHELFNELRDLLRKHDA